jgi:hypothetical protein
MHDQRSPPVSLAYVGIDLYRHGTPMSSSWHACDSVPWDCVSGHGRVTLTRQDVVNSSRVTPVVGRFDTRFISHRLHSSTAI